MTAAFTGASTSTAFLSWWGGELRGFWPGSPQRGLAGARDALVVRLDGRTVEATLVDSAGAQEAIDATEVAPEDWGGFGTNFIDALRQVNPRRVDTVVVLGEGQVVRRHLRVPPTRGGDLAGLLSFEVERHTPFKPEETYFAYTARAGEAPDAPLNVTLYVAPRRIVDPVVERLTEIGYPPARVVIGEEDGTPVVVPGIGGGARRTRFARLGALLLVVLLAAAAVSPLLRLESVAHDLERAVATARRDAERTMDSRSESMRAAETVRFLAERKSDRPALLVVLNDLAALLPDGTWLVQLTTSGADVVLEGQTQSSAALIPLLEGSPHFESVSYEAPVTREGTGGTEHFTFSLRLAGEGS